ERVCISCGGGHPYLPSFPTRRSSDLGEVEAGLAAAGDSDDVLTREYRRGDAMRRVHWRATARAGDLRVRQEEHHAEVSSLVILRSEEHTSELQSRENLVCRLLLENKK